MTNIRKFKNYDSDIHALLAYELAVESQHLMYAMAGIAALAEAHNHLSLGRPMTVRVAMEKVRLAIVNEAMASASNE